MNINQKLFLVVVISFMTLEASLYLLPVGTLRELIFGASAGALLGILLLVVFWFIQTAITKIIPSYGKYNPYLTAHKVKNIELMSPYSTAFDLCISSVNTIRKCRIQTKNISDGMIIAETGMTWHSCGEIISFELRKIGNMRTHVKVSSKPNLFIVFGDKYGKNIENVEKIIRFLRENCKTT